MKNTITLAALLVMSLVAFHGLAQVNTEEFAQESLEKYRSLLTTSTVRSVGFESLDEAKQAELGEAIQVMVMDLDVLKGVKLGAGTTSLSLDKSVVWYPVVVKGEIQAKLEVVDQDGRLVSGAFGAGDEARTVASAMETVPGGATKPYLLRIPYLRAMFVAFSTGEGEFLIPAMSMPQRFDLENNKTYPAGDVLKTLKEFAEKLPEGLIG